MCDSIVLRRCGAHLANHVSQMQQYMSLISSGSVFHKTVAMRPSILSITMHVFPFRLNEQYTLKTGIGVCCDMNYIVRASARSLNSPYLTHILGESIRTGPERPLKRRMTLMLAMVRK